MNLSNWNVGDIVWMYFGMASPGLGPTVGLITAPGKKEDHWKVMYESQSGTRIAELPALIFYKPED